jgi:6-phospho-beta-glucosidase
MKVTIIGAGGVRTPQVVRAFIARQERLGLDELALMDINGARLDLMAALTAPLEAGQRLRFRLTRTTDPAQALAGADFVITTFRVGDIAGRAADERVALDHGVLGQETTGPGGFAMGLRTIPVLFGYLDVMRQACPEAWLINFANPAGMLAEAVINHGRWPRAVGICDAPSGMQRGAAHLLGARPDDVYLEYFGLNHLGWARAVWHQGRDRLPELLDLFDHYHGPLPGYPFEPGLIRALGMLPNEYLYYYYYRAEAVANLLAKGRSRGEQLAELNARLFADLERARAAEDFDAMQALFAAYFRERGETYFAAETGGKFAGEAAAPSEAQQNEQAADEGYAGVALNVMEALAGHSSRVLHLNVANRGAIAGMREDDVVEVPCWVSGGLLRPLAIGSVPDHALGLMKQVKAYERLTVEAALSGSYAAALNALALHPLVPSHAVARALLDDYIAQHAEDFPRLR